MAPDADLNNSIKPLSYDLSISNLELGGAWGYDGVVTIDSKVSKETDKIVLNTKELEIKSADVLAKGGNGLRRTGP